MSLKKPLHTPYKNGKGGIRVGLQPISESEWLEIDDLFESEIFLKKNLLESHKKEVYQEIESSKTAQSEFLELLIQYLQKFHPQKYFFEDDYIQVNLQEHSLKLSRNDYSPLELASLLVQEDLVLMLKGDEDYFLGAASLCAPSNWSLAEKFKGSLMALHKEVPGYQEKIGQRVGIIFKKLPENRILERFNWSIYDSPKLFQPAKSKFQVTKGKALSYSNVGTSLFVRVERQTIRRLSLSQAIAFTIRVHISPLSAIQHDKNLLNDLFVSIKNLDSKMKEYKSLDGIEEILLEWLKEKKESAL